MSLHEELKNYFKIYASISDEILRKCEQICHTYNVSPEDLADQWGAYSASNLTNSIPTLNALENMERKEFSNDFSKRVIGTPTTKKDSYDVVEEFDPNSAVNSFSTTPKSVKSNAKRFRSPNRDQLQKEILTPVSAIVSSPSTPSQTYDYTQRTNAGKIEVSYGTQNLLKNASFKRNPNDNENEITVNLLSETNTLSSDVRYMYNVNNVKASNINTRIEWIGKYLINKFGLGEPQAFVKVTGSMTAYGQICCDTTGKLDAASVLLEGSQELTHGNTIELNLSKLSNYAIFPGQIVAVQGFNPNGNSIIVQKLYSDATISTTNTSHTPAKFTKPLHIIVAVGPFTLSNNLLYQPLQDLIKYVTNNIPHLLILIGPFLDSSQENISDITTMDLYDTFFEKLLDYVMMPLEGLNVHVVLVPSAKDAHHHVVYPTPPYKIRKKYTNLHCISDPSLLNINGLILGTTSTDVLLHLSKQEFCSSFQGGDRISRLASHLLCQKSFYPLYPSDEDVSIDYELLEQHGLINVIPNVLIVPSNLRYFIKYINGCVVINPERLTKGYVGGTFCRIEVCPTTSSGTISDNIVAQIIRV